METLPYAYGNFAMDRQSSFGSDEAVILITERFELSHHVYHVFRPIIAQQRLIELEFVVFICLILFFVIYQWPGSNDAIVIWAVLGRLLVVSQGGWCLRVRYGYEFSVVFSFAKKLYPLQREGW
jgi:hypothetical protein